MNNHVFTQSSFDLALNIMAIKVESLRLKVGKSHAEIAALADYQNQKGKTVPQGPHKPLS